MISSLLLGFVMLQGPVDTRGQERTVFQTGSPYKDRINIGADVAIVYGIDKSMPDRVRGWRNKGYKVHLMTGVAWGEYQDYYFGRWDGVNHEEEAQAKQNGEKIGHGRDVYYMSPGANYGKYLASGVRRALEVGVEAVHLEEPEFWNFGGYGVGFKKEWKSYYNEEWQDPTSSPDARWRAAKLMYFLYRRALQQVFDSIQEYNKEHGTKVRCYVPTHSLLNYSSWNIVSPESSLAKLNGCDGYIAQVWTGTARTPNFYQGVEKERTFETAFLEYGSMQNLVRSTGRSVWYLADPIEDNPDHDWGDYRTNYHATLLASLLQPEVSQYEVMPWPERIFTEKYPSETDKGKRVLIPDEYATELQTVINALRDMDQKSVKWESGSHGIGVMASDSLMFQRGGPSASDAHLGHFYGLALPFVKRGVAVEPVQLENVTLPHYLDNLKVILMSYEGMKPLSADVHDAIAKWVKGGGTLAFVDADKDPFLAVREWWNEGANRYKSPREHLFEVMGLDRNPAEGAHKVGRGKLVYLKRSPSEISHSADGASWLAEKIKNEGGSRNWSESSALVLRRGPYVVAAGMDETVLPVKSLKGSFVDLFDSELRFQNVIELKPGARHLLVDLAKTKQSVIAASGRLIQKSSSATRWTGSIEGIADTKAIVLLRAPSAVKKVTLSDGATVQVSYDGKLGLVWLRFPSQSRVREIDVEFSGR